MKNELELSERREQRTPLQIHRSILRAEMRYLRWRGSIDHMLDELCGFDSRPPAEYDEEG